MLEWYKHLWGDGANFSRRRKGRMVIIYRGIVYAKIFYGRIVLYSGGMASPLNSSIAYGEHFLKACSTLIYAAAFRDLLNKCVKVLEVQCDNFRHIILRRVFTKIGIQIIQRDGHRVWNFEVTSIEPL